MVPKFLVTQCSSPRSSRVLQDSNLCQRYIEGDVPSLVTDAGPEAAHDDVRCLLQHLCRLPLTPRPPLILRLVLTLYLFLHLQKHKIYNIYMYMYTSTQKPPQVDGKDFSVSSFSLYIYSMRQKNGNSKVTTFNHFMT